MKHIAWDATKNMKLKQERGIGFEDVLIQINDGKMLDIIDHPSKRKYPTQKVFVLEIQEYVYYIPFVENENEVFLKTIIPSRKLKKRYSRG